jgi:hypothetical protein
MIVCTGNRIDSDVIPRLSVQNCIDYYRGRINGEDPEGEAFVSGIIKVSGNSHTPCHYSGLSGKISSLQSFYSSTVLP